MFGIPFQALALQMFMGFTLGSIFILMAIGFSLIFGMLTIVNFAHGAFYTWGAFLILFIVGNIGNFWIGLILVPILVGVMGLIIERTLIRRLYGLSIDYPLLLTFGLSMIMTEIIRVIWGFGDHPFNIPHLLQDPINLGLFFFPSYWLFVIAITWFILFVLWILLKKTELGLIIRAGSRDSIMVRTLGINISKIWLLVFGIGTSLAGLAGLLAAPMRSVYPEMGLGMLIECFVVVVVGGMGSLKGAICSGILMGLVVSLTTLIYPAMSNITIYIAMAVVLLVRPSGLFGERGLLE